MFNRSTVFISTLMISLTFATSALCADTVYSISSPPYWQSGACTPAPSGTEPSKNPLNQFIPTKFIDHQSNDTWAVTLPDSTTKIPLHNNSYNLWGSTISYTFSKILGTLTLTTMTVTIGSHRITCTGKGFTYAKSNSTR